MKPKTLEEAKSVIEKFPHEDDFVTENLSRWIGGDGEYYDNSIELSDYWRECKSMTSEYLFHKHG